MRSAALVAIVAALALCLLCATLMTWDENSAILSEKAGSAPEDAWDAQLHKLKKQFDDSLSSSVIAESKNDDAKPKHVAKPVVISLKDSGNMQYYGAVHIGTPPTKFLLNFDTGSQWLWIPEKECLTCAKHQTYTLGSSSTMQKTEFGRTMQNYGTGKIVGGAVMDQVSFLGLDGKSKAADLTVVTADEVEGAVLQAAPFDGILGLNRVSAKVKRHGKKHAESNFLRQAYLSGVLPKAMLSLLLGSEGQGKGGVAVLGGVDKRFMHGSELSWVPVLKDTEGNWAIKIHSLRVGDEKKNYCGKAGCVGVIDSGTWGIIGTGKVIKPVLEAAMILKPDIPCNLEGLPRLHFDVGTGDALSLDLVRTADVMHKKENICEPAVQAMELPLDFKGHKDSPVLLLGDPFLRTFYTVLDNTDVENPRVGIAKGNLEALEEILASA